MRVWFNVLNFLVYSFWTLKVTYAVAPVINNLPNSTTLAEGTTTEISLYSLDVTDADGDAITSCSFDPSGTVPGSGTNKFQLQQIGGTWGLYTKSSEVYDYNAQSSYTLAIECDANGDTATGTFDVYLSKNAVPVIQNLPASVNVSTLTSGVGDSVFTVTGSDAENDQIRYSKTCDPVSPACPFDIFNSGAIQLNADISSITVTGYDVIVDIEDDYGTGESKTLTILFTDLNSQPTIQNLGNTIGIPENGALGETIVTTTCTDNDVADTLVYSMTCTPTSGSTYFLLNSTSGEITTTTSSVINYEYLLSAGSTSFNCTVSCSDGRVADTADVVLDVTNVNEAPTFSQNAWSISANEGAGGTVIQVTPFSVNEEDSGDSTTYNLDCGTSSGYFSINTGTGIISYSIEYDVDDASRPTSVSCNVTVTDSGGLSDTATVTITINNINDNVPVFSQTSYVWFLSEVDPVGTTVGTAAATDGDIGVYGNITYSLDQSSLTAEYFQIDQSGTVTLQSSYGAGVTPTFYVLASDGGGSETQVPVIVVIAATTTTTSTASPNRYKTFFDDPRNIAWFTACCILLAITIIVTGWMCFSCTGASAKYGYSAFQFRCCSCWEEEPRTIRNWGEGHRNQFRLKEFPQDY